MLYTFLHDTRQNVATDIALITKKDLPEVTGVKAAAALAPYCEQYNEAELQACVARQIERLGIKP